jgi:hypothetical protein
MNVSESKLPPNPRFSNLACALGTVALLSFTCWANSAQFDQASHEIQQDIYADYISLLNRNE